ncbi:helix-turn-helix domain containing protein [Leuconostocaceae bacterium ESL0958]|nr:helix-turn-helix domain containing protein [Leuconostocaceae bacterium ESL0958]
MDQIVRDFITLSENKAMTPAQKKVLQAAIQLFAAQGFAGTSTAAIAQTAGVSQGTIFKYYDNKERLLEVILDLVIDNLLPKYSDDFINAVEKQDQQSFADFMNFVLVNRYDFIVQNGQVLTILFSELMIDDQLVNQIRDLLLPQWPRLTALFEKKAGKTAQLSGDEMVHLLISQLLLLFLQKERLKESEPILKQRLAVIQQLMVRAVGS